MTMRITSKTFSTLLLQEIKIVNITCFQRAANKRDSFISFTIAPMPTISKFISKTTLKHINLKEWLKPKAILQSLLRVS